MEPTIDRLRNLGIKSLSVPELLALAISATPDDVDDALEIGAMLVKDCGHKVSEVPKISLNAWIQIGISEFDSIRFSALMEIGRRSVESGKGERILVNGPEQAAEICKDLAEAKEEHFDILLLDSKNQLIQRVPLHKGTVNASLVGVKELYREAVRYGAVSVIAVHNHPSGDPTPSPEDIEVTRKLKEAGRLLEIDLLDHIIIGGNKHQSLQRLGAIG